MDRYKPSVVIDTCIWIDLVEGKYEERMLTILENLVGSYRIELVVPAQITQEWNRIKNERTLVATEHYLNSAKDSIKKVLEIAKNSKHSEISVQLESSITLLEDLKPAILQKYTDLVQRIDSLFNDKKTIHISLSEAKKSSLIDDILIKKEPFFHGKKKSMGDAIIFFSTLEYLENSDKELYFISSNTKDFGGDELDINLQEIVNDNFTYYKTLSTAINSLEEWSEEVEAYLQSEEEAELSRQESDWRNTIKTISCDICGEKDKPGRIVYISGEIDVMAFCLECSPNFMN